MLTTIVVTICVFALIWSIKTLAKGQDALAALVAPVAVLGIVVMTCWEIVLGIAVLALMVRTLGGISGNGGGVKILKGGMVGAALILALPPFWPITIPLLACMLVGYLCCAPLSLLFGSIKDFMGD